MRMNNFAYWIFNTFNVLHFICNTVRLISAVHGSDQSVGYRIGLDLIGME